MGITDFLAVTRQFIHIAGKKYIILKSFLVKIYSFIIRLHIT